MHSPSKRRGLAALFALGLAQSSLLAPVAAAQTQPPQQQIKVGAVASDVGKDYRIQPGDIVSIAVFPAEEYSRELTVQPDGKIELSLIGSILVKGLTSRELQDLLAEKYSKYVANPQVTVNVRKFAGRRVAIIGEIRTAGYYEYRDGMRLLELISLAGGLSDNAKASRINVLRYGADLSNASFVANMKPVLEGDLTRDVPLAPGDTVYVPKGRITVSALWMNTNILPWLSLMTLIASMIILADDKTN